MVHALRFVQGAMLVACILIVSAGSVFAQTDGSAADPSAQSTGTAGGANPSTTDPTSAPKDPTAIPPLPSAADFGTSTAASPGASTTNSPPTNTTPAAATAAPVPTATPSNAVAPAPTDIAATTTVVATTTDIETSSGMSPLVWLVIAALALLPFGYLTKQLLAKKPASAAKPDKQGGQCFDLKKMLDDKLTELTDVRAQIEGKIKSAAKSELRDAVTGTVAGDLITRADALEAEYNRIKKLFEQCMWDSGGTVLRGMLVESSLVDTEILKKLVIKDTRLEGDWTVHDVETTSGLLPELAKRIADGPWYMHFWEPGKDAIRVVFKDKTFEIVYSDKTTWSDAVAHGVALGIPVDQLDFKMHDTR